MYLNYYMSFDCCTTVSSHEWKGLIYGPRVTSGQFADQAANCGQIIANRALAKPSDVWGPLVCCSVEDLLTGHRTVTLEGSVYISELYIMSFRVVSNDEDREFLMALVHLRRDSYAVDDATHRGL